MPQANGKVVRYHLGGGAPNEDWPAKRAVMPVPVRFVRTARKERTMLPIFRGAPKVAVAAFAAFFVLAASGRARAQTASTGALTGRVVDASTGRPVVGVTVVAQGPHGDQADLTDADGIYNITDLLPGNYVVRFYFANVKVERPNVEVSANKKIQVN